MKPKSCKAKGRVFQQQIRDMLRKVAADMNLGLEDGDIESREMGQQGTDIRLSPSAKALLDVCVECKKVESINVAAVFKKHFDNYEEKDPGSLKVLFHSKNRGQTLATIRAEDLMDMLRDQLLLKSVLLKYLQTGEGKEEVERRLEQAIDS